MLTEGSEQLEVSAEELEIPAVEPKPSAIRWYMLLMFTLCLALGAFIANTYAPIAQSLRAIFDWSDPTFATYAIYQEVFGILSVLIVTMLTIKYGIRAYTLTVQGMCVIAAAMRCVNVHNLTIITVLGHANTIITAIATCAIPAFSPILAATWFPPKEWAFATAFVYAVSNTGFAMSFLIGPAVVSEPNGDDYQQIWNQVFNYSYGTLAIFTIVFLIILLYFPSRPKIIPSYSAGVERQRNVLQTSKELLRKKQFWLLTIQFCCISENFGLLFQWTPWMESLGQNQVASGYIAAFSIIGSVLAAITLGKLVDVLKQNTGKAFTLAAGCLITMSGLWIALIQFNVISQSLLSVAIPTAVYLFTGLTIVSIQIELIVQMLYPISEVLVSVWIHIIFAFTGFIFSGLTYYGYSWIGLYLMISAIFGMVVCYFLPYHSQRLVHEQSFAQVESARTYGT